jgi:hypothetical protein
MITTTFNDGVLYMVGRYTVMPGSRNCERSAVSTDYTVKPGIENCYIIKNHKNGPPVHCSTEHRDLFEKVDNIRSLHCFNYKEYWFR